MVAQLCSSMPGSISHSGAAALQVLHCWGQERPQQAPSFSQTRPQTCGKGAHKAQQGTDKGCMSAQLLQHALGVGQSKLLCEGTRQGLSAPLHLLSKCQSLTARCQCGARKRLHAPPSA